MITTACNCFPNGVLLTVTAVAVGAVHHRGVLAAAVAAIIVVVDYHTIVYPAVDHHGVIAIAVHHHGVVDTIVNHHAVAVGRHGRGIAAGLAVAKAVEMAGWLGRGLGSCWLRL